MKHNMFVFMLGFTVILFGIMLARKLKLIGGTLMSKQDRKLVDKAKRALGFSSQPKQCVSRDLTNRVEGNEFNIASREKLT